MPGGNAAVHGENEANDAEEQAEDESNCEFAGGTAQRGDVVCGVYVVVVACLLLPQEQGDVQEYIRWAVIIGIIRIGIIIIISSSSSIDAVLRGTRIREDRMENALGIAHGGSFGVVGFKFRAWDDGG